jgi:hypothetical protein
MLLVLHLEGSCYQGALDTWCTPAKRQLPKVAHALFDKAGPDMLSPLPVAE